MNTRINQLLQLTKVTWDGDLISKSARDRLVEVGLSTKCYGFNFLTSNGVKALSDLGLLKEETPLAAAQGEGQFTAHNSSTMPLSCKGCVNTGTICYTCVRNATTDSYDNGTD